MSTERITTERVSWYNITEATIHDIAMLRRAFPDFHPLNLEDALSYIERPKIDFHDDYLYVVMQFPRFDSTSRLTRGSEVDFFVGKDYIVTIHDGLLRPLNDLYDRSQKNEEVRHHLLGGSSGHAFYVMVDQLVDNVFPILNKVEGRIRGIEENIFEERDATGIIREIAIVRRDVIALRRIVRAQIPILSSIERSSAPFLHEEMDEYFGDLIDHAQKARDVVDEDYEIIFSLSDTADKLLTHRLNNVIRILTIFSVILLPLSLISGIFGMNVTLPLQERDNAFALIIGLMLIIAVVMLIVFRRRRYL